MNEVSEFQLGEFELRHEVSQSSLADSKRFQIGGHWYPVISIGRGADQLRLPCFVVSSQHITLPTFGPFKGGMKQNRQKELGFIQSAMEW